MIDNNHAPNVTSMAHFFNKSCTEFWLPQMLAQRMVGEIGDGKLPPLLRQKIARRNDITRRRATSKACIFLTALSFAGLVGWGEDDGRIVPRPEPGSG